MKAKTKRRPAAAIYAELNTLAGHIRTLGYANSASRIEDCVRDLKRRPPTRRAPVTSTPMTPEIAAKIRETAWKHPTWSQQRIATRLGVNSGRVSEILFGKRAGR